MKVRIPHSSAIVKGIAEGTIEWEIDPDFGYEVATNVPGIDAADHGILRPRELFEKFGRSDEYRGWVDRLNTERSEYLESFSELDPRIRNSIG
jgi:phosphoenolpyruvate carboxykinase (ATP)